MIKWTKKDVNKAVAESMNLQKVNPIQEQINKIKKIKLPRIGQ